MATLHQIPIKTAARKLPVKRKNPSSPSNPNPNPNPNLPKPETPPSSSSDPLIDDDEESDDLKPPPFKFHRIWSESDEIHFLQGLLDSSADGLVFPRHLNLFFDRFSLSMPQPYTNSQLSEKLRRLRKKFRVVSARLDRGLDASHLTPHDRSLLHLSKQLWHPAFAASSPFSATGKKIPAAPPRVTANPSLPLHDDDDLNREDFQSGRGSGQIGRAAAKTVMDVFDRSLTEVRTVLVRRGLLFPDHPAAGGSKRGKGRDLTKKWQEQRVAELDVLARRLRLVLEHAIHE